MRWTSITYHGPLDDDAYERLIRELRDEAARHYQEAKKSTPKSMPMPERLPSRPEVPAAFRRAFAEGEA